MKKAIRPMLTEKEIRLINELLENNKPQSVDAIKLKHKFSLMLFKIEMMNDEE